MEAEYFEVSEAILHLPYEVEEMLIKEFDGFVKDYDTLRKDFEIFFYRRD